MCRRWLMWYRKCYCLLDLVLYFSIYWFLETSIGLKILDHFWYLIEKRIYVDTLIIYLDKLVMEISFDIFLFFWMEKKLILLSHICSIEYMGLVLSLWSLESNGNAYSTKNRPFWSSSYLATSITFFAIVVLLFLYFLHCVA